MIKTSSLFHILSVIHSESKPEEQLLEQEMVQAFILGDKAGFDWIYERYQEPIFHFCSKMVFDQDLAADLMQETFIRVLGYKEKIKPKQGIKNLLFTVAGNLCRDKARKAGRQPEVSLNHEEDEHLHQVASETRDNETDAHYAELESILETSIEKLPEKQKRAILLKKCSNMTFIELGEALDCTDRYAKKLVKQGLDFLTLQLEKAGFQEGGDIA